MNSDELYLDLLRRCLTRYGFEQPYEPVCQRTVSVKAFAFNLMARHLLRRGMTIMRENRYAPQDRHEGRDWPVHAETMAGILRLDNMQACIEGVVKNHVPGDILEAGVWRGGVCIFARAVLQVLGVTNRVVWVADSFQGVPRPSHPVDAGDKLYQSDRLRVSLQEVRDNFARYGFLDEQVRFIEGWFKESLPGPVGSLAVLRLDGDLYSSTWETLEALYPCVSPGGFVIVDDYGAMASCRQAVDEYRNGHGITEAIRMADWTCAYWQKISIDEGSTP